MIPSDRISPQSASLLQYLPNPDRPGSGIGGLDSNKSFAPFINPHIQHVWGFTIDQTLTPTQSRPLQPMAQQLQQLQLRRQLQPRFCGRTQPPEQP